MNSVFSRDEPARLAALHAYGILDTPPEPGFEHITSLVTRLFRVPMAAVTLVDAERQWFKSIRGLDWQETPREGSFCAHAMWGKEIMVVTDATLDRRFAENPLVSAENGIRFYAGAPLRTPEGQPLGALCVMDRQPRELTPTEQQQLSEIASLVEDELLLRRFGRELRAETLLRERAEVALLENKRQPDRFPADMAAASLKAEAAEADLPAHEVHFREMVEQAGDAMFMYDLNERILEVNTAACHLVGYTREELLGLRVSDIDLGFDPVKGPRRWHEMVPGEAVTTESFNRRKDGKVFPAEARISVVETGRGRVLLALVRDISQRKRAERSLQVRARQQQAVAELGVKALSGGEVETLLDDAVATVAGTLGLEICNVLEHLPARKELLIRAGLNLAPDERGKRAAVDSPKYAAGYVLRTGEPLIVKDFRKEKRAKATAWLKARGAVSGLTVPVGENKTGVPRYGILNVYTQAQREFTEDDMYFVQAVANILATSIERQRGEDALRVVEARYRRIAAHTPGVVYQYLIHPDGTVAIPFISESCRTLYGREPHEVQAHPEVMLNHIHAEDRPGLEDAMRRCEEALLPLHWQGRHLLPTGEVRWVRFESRPERLPDGSVICDGILIDLTEEEQRKEVLRQSEERFRLANLHAPYPTMLHTDDGEVLQVNDAWTHITGYLPRELPTLEAWLRLAYPSEEEREVVRSFIAKTWEQIGAAQNPGRRVRCANGEERIWDVSAVNLGRLPDDRWLRLVTAIDVTERRKQEEALRLAKEEAERANQAKSVFLSRMSHELRTPLNAILGFGQVLELSPLEEQEAQSVRYILKGGRHLLALVDEVLDLARVEADELSLTLSAVSFDQIAPDCAGLVARMAQTRGIACTVEASPACRVSIRADGQRLRQVLLNLLANAIKYNREGGQVTLSCEQTADDRIRLKVRDTGPGISPEGLARLFVPFERLGQELGEVEGTGLGLVVAKRLVEAMGGILGVESQLGQGTAFWVELPVAPHPLATEATGRGPAIPTSTAPEELPSPTLLYIEDNVSNVQVVQTVVARLRPRWRFLSARSGQNGLQQAREHSPEAILLDLQLPGMNGDEVLAALRADPVTARIPVLLLSADATTHSRERLLGLGANDYLSKPFGVGDLLKKLDILLQTAHPPEK